VVVKRAGGGNPRGPRADDYYVNRGHVAGVAEPGMSEAKP
jgi:hypothetical protein